MRLRTTLYIIAFVMLSLASFGQQLPFNQYGNELWAGDSIVGFPQTPAVGFQYRPASSFPVFSRLSLPITPQDSNTYTRMIYRITNIRNQSLGARIHRPLSANEALDIDIQRTSNEGWVTSSQSRYTRAFVSLSKEFLNDHLRLEVEGKALIFDRDQNGGLRQDDYTFSEGAGQFGQLNNDIYITSAFNRLTDYVGNLSVSYDLNDKLEIGVRGQLRRERFLFDDNTGDKAFYDSLRLDTNLTGVRDSNRIATWGVGAFARYEIRKDSTALSWLELDYNQDAIRYRSLSPTQFTTNSMVALAYHRHRERSRWLLGGSYVLAGYNQADLRLRTSYDRILVSNADSSGHATGLDAHIQMNAQRYEPAVIYERYTSNFYSYANDLSKVSAFDVNVGLKGYRGAFSYGATVEGQARENFVFLNEDLLVSQTEDVLAILGIDLRAGLRTKGFDVSIRGRYQNNLFNDVYDVPAFIGVTDASFTFPLFSKSIYLRAGFDGWYFSEYRARGYFPLNDLYYLQTSREYGNYIQFNPYMMATIQSVDVKFRLMNANYGLISDDPLVGPGYASVPLYFEFKVDWTFKN